MVETTMHRGIYNGEGEFSLTERNEEEKDPRFSVKLHYLVGVGSKMIHAGMVVSSHDYRRQEQGKKWIVLGQYWRKSPSQPRVFWGCFWLKNGSYGELRTAATRGCFCM